MTLYRDYEQAALDAQYNNRARVPDFQSILDAWAEDSARTRAKLPCELDIPYGPGGRDHLDIFPAGPRPAPALVFIHGGYWQSLDKSSFSFPARALVDAGVSYVATSYPIAPVAGMDEIVDAIRRALAWLWRDGAAHGIERERLYVAGHSAGGHLTAMALATDWPSVAPDLPADLVRGGLAISGLYDLEPIRLSYLNAVLGLDAAVAARNSPIRLAPDAAPPLALAVGALETDELRRQQADFLRAWRAPARPASALEVPGHDHFSILRDLADAESALFRSLLSLVAGRGAA